MKRGGQPLFLQRQSARPTTSVRSPDGPPTGWSLLRHLLRRRCLTLINVCSSPNTPEEVQLLLLLQASPSARNTTVWCFHGAEPAHSSAQI